MKINGECFWASVIAQDDDNDYSESGYVVTLIGNTASIFEYSHCSCYGTWEALGGNTDHKDDDIADITPKWEGSYADLIRMATEKRDPAMPERAANPSDYEYDHLMNVYAAVLKRHEEQGNKGD